MNKKIIFWWWLWTMALIWDEYWMLVSALINYKVHTAKQFKGWKKGTRSRMLIEKENSSHKQLMSNLTCCNSCRKVGRHVVHVLLSKNLIISFWRKHAYTATEIHMGQASTNFHSLPPTCLTIYLIMLNVPENYLNCFITVLLTQIFILSLFTCNLAFVIWAHNEQIGQG